MLQAIGFLLPWIVAAFGCYIGYQLIKQNGRILLQLELLQVRLNAMLVPAGNTQQAVEQGLPLGSAAPNFELPRANGGRQKLSDFVGKRTLLIFFNPQCGFCQQMMPDLAELTGKDPVPLIVSTGDAQQNRELFEKHGVRWTVLLQKQMEIAAKYKVAGTPMGYLIDEGGKIASEITTGAPALLALADGRVGSSAVAAENGNGHKAFKGNRTLAESRINRDGLKPGTQAPDFRLSRVDGGELSLEQYRGRPVLLVFSAPDCGPCNSLAPKLQQQYQLHPEISVVMISRGDEGVVRTKVAEHGLTFPVALQQHWEISRLYGIFATPIAYYIDANGIINSEVAIGEESILGLFSGRMARAA